MSDRSKPRKIRGLTSIATLDPGDRLILCFGTTRLCRLHAQCRDPVLSRRWPQPTLSPDNGGNFVVPRSYIANRSAEGLSLSQLDDPVETMVITEKWEYANEDAEGGDLWLESFKGDFND